MHDVAGVGLVLLELRGRDLVHAQLAWLQRNTVVVHYHFWLERLIDEVSVSLSHASQTVGIEEHVLLRLERLVHVVYLSVWAHCTASLRHYLFLAD